MAGGRRLDLLAPGARSSEQADTSQSFVARPTAGVWSAVHFFKVTRVAFPSASFFNIREDANGTRSPFHSLLSGRVYWPYFAFAS